MDCSTRIHNDNVTVNLPTGHAKIFNGQKSFHKSFQMTSTKNSPVVSVAILYLLIYLRVMSKFSTTRRVFERVFG